MQVFIPMIPSFLLLSILLYLNSKEYRLRFSPQKISGVVVTKTRVHKVQEEDLTLYSFVPTLQKYIYPMATDGMQH